jgi:hypothetical protein
MTALSAREAGPRRGLQVRHLTVVVPFFLVAVAAVRGIVDNSFLWHVRAGTLQLDLGRVLTSDPFSYASPDVGWRTQSWLAELGYGLMERWTGGLGWVGVALFLTGAATLLFVGLTIYHRVRSPLAVAVWLVVLAWLAVPPLQPRPVVLSFVFLALAALILRLDPALQWALLPTMWLWAAFHGSWITGIALIVLTAIERRSWRLASVGALGVVVASATAHGLGVWEVLVSFVTNTEALRLIQEWLPPDFSDPVQGPYVLAIVGVLIAATKGRIAPRELIVVIPFLLFGLTSRRAVYPAAIVLIPYAAAFWVPRTRERVTGGPVVYVTAVLVLALVLAPLVLVAPGLEEDRFPNDAVLDAAGSQPMFHSDLVGGYLIWKRWPEEQMFIDDRAELFGADFFHTYQEAILGRYEALFDDYGMTSVIADPEWPLVTVLKRDGWTVPYEGEHWVVLKQPDGD